MAAADPIRHLNCGTMCPAVGKLIGTPGGLLSPGRMVCHCLLIEGTDGLVLVDTGFGSGDVRDPNRLGRPFRAMVRPQLEIGETAVAQVKALGRDPGDVRHVVVTHLDLDHAGGLSDFPEAEVHVFAAEREAAEKPSLSDRTRYIDKHWAHGPRWADHHTGGDEWQGFESIRLLPGADPEVLMVPLAGHSRGHTGIAIRQGDGWLLHCGDAFFHRGEVETPPHCPPGLRIFQNLTQVDRGARIRNQERLRELADREGDGVELICSHDPEQLDRAQAAQPA